MPLVMLCGQPCSGKSSTVKALAKLFEAEGQAPVVVDESILNMGRNRAYAGAPTVGPPSRIPAGCSGRSIACTQPWTRTALVISPVSAADATAEKNTRASFKAEVDRRLSRKAVVILDAVNNIKGYR